jgi:hypothetical protein
VYVTFAGIGVDRLTVLGKGSSSLARTALPIVFVLPLLFGMHELFGFRGQLTPVEYPASWYEARAVLDSTPSEDKMLVLPWQGYFSLPFNNQLLVANPTSRFFGRDQTIAGRAVGMENIYDQEIDAEYRQIDTFLHEISGKTQEAVTDFLQSHHIKYLFVVVNESVENQNTWLLPPKIVPETEITDTVAVTDPEESLVITGLLQAPHEKMIDSEVILYHFNY